MKISLQSDADLLAVPSTALQLLLTATFGSGPMPSTLEDNMKIALEEIFTTARTSIRLLLIVKQLSTKTLQLSILSLANPFTSTQSKLC